MIKRLVLSLLLLCLIFLVVSCGSEPEEAAERAQEIAVDLEPEQEAEQEVKATEAPSSTPLPTNTPQPTGTPLPTDTPLPTATTEPTSTTTAVPTKTPKPTNTPTTIPPTEPPPTQSPPTAAPPTQPPPTEPPPTPEPQPTAPPAVVALGNLIITAVNKRDEYVDIRNDSGQDIDLNGWRLVSEKGNQECRLGGVIINGTTWRILALAEDAGQGGFNCQFDSNIWNNSDPDPAVLYDPTGAEVSRR